MEEAAEIFNFSLAAWAELCELLLPEVYCAEPDPEPMPAMLAVSQQTRVVVFEARVRAGYAARRQDDPPKPDDLRPRSEQPRARALAPGLDFHDDEDDYLDALEKLR